MTKGQHQEADDHIEYRMRIGYLAGKIVGSVCDQVSKRKNERQKKDHTGDVDEDLGIGGSFGGSAGLDGSQATHDTGADIGTQYDGNSHGQSDAVAFTPLR